MDINRFDIDNDDDYDLLASADITFSTERNTIHFTNNDEQIDLSTDPDYIYSEKQTQLLFDYENLKNTLYQQGYHVKPTFPQYFEYYKNKE